MPNDSQKSLRELLESEELDSPTEEGRGLLAMHRFLKGSLAKRYANVVRDTDKLINDSPWDLDRMLELLKNCADCTEFFANEMSYLALTVGVIEMRNHQRTEAIEKEMRDIKVMPPGLLEEVQDIEKEVQDIREIQLSLREEVQDIEKRVQDTKETQLSLREEIQDIKGMVRDILKKVRDISEVLDIKLAGLQKDQRFMAVDQLTMKEDIQAIKDELRPVKIVKSLFGWIPWIGRSSK